MENPYNLTAEEQQEMLTEFVDEATGEVMLVMPTKKRVQWFRSVYKTGQVLTNIEHVFTEPVLTCIMKATITDEQGKILATGHACCSYSDTVEYRMHPVESAETMAVGRAMANAGFGTQFCGTDLDTPGPVDSPIHTGKTTENPKPAAAESAVDATGNTTVKQSDEDFETEVTKYMGSMTKSKAGGIMLSYGAKNLKTVKEAFMECKQKDKAADLRPYTHPGADEERDARIVAACRYFVEKYDESLNKK